MGPPGRQFDRHDQRGHARPARAGTACSSPHRPPSGSDRPARFPGALRPVARVPDGLRPAGRVPSGPIGSGRPVSPVGSGPVESSVRFAGPLDPWSIGWLARPDDPFAWRASLVRVILLAPTRLPRPGDLDGPLSPIGTGFADPAGSPDRPTCSTHPSTKTRRPERPAEPDRHWHSQSDRLTQPDGPASPAGYLVPAIWSARWVRSVAGLVDPAA
jgi:hypothetical protein